MPDVGSSLFDLLTWALRLMDEDTNMPRIGQGQNDVGTGGATKFEIEVRTERAQKYSGSVIRNFDHGIIEPVIQFKLDYNLTDPALAHIAGPFRVQANGFTSFQNRQVRQQNLARIFDRLITVESLQKKFPLEPVFEEWIKTLDVNPDQFERSDEEIAQIEEREAQEIAAQQPPGPDPQLEAQQAEHQMQLEQMDAEGRAQIQAAQAEEHRAGAQARLMTGMGQSERARMQGQAALVKASQKPNGSKPKFKNGETR